MHVSRNVKYKSVLAIYWVALIRLLFIMKDVDNLMKSYHSPFYSINNQYNAVI